MTYGITFGKPVKFEKTTEVDGKKVVSTKIVTSFKLVDILRTTSDWQEIKKKKKQKKEPVQEQIEGNSTATD